MIFLSLVCFCYYLSPYHLPQVRNLVQLRIVQGGFSSEFLPRSMSLFCATGDIPVVVDIVAAAATVIGY